MYHMISSLCDRLPTYPSCSRHDFGNDGSQLKLYWCEYGDARFRVELIEVAERIRRLAVLLHGPSGFSRSAP